MTTQQQYIYLVAVSLNRIVSIANEAVFDCLSIAYCSDASKQDIDLRLACAQAKIRAMQHQFTKLEQDVAAAGEAGGEPT